VASAPPQASLALRARTLSPLLARHDIGIRFDRIRDARRSVADAVTDPRPLHAEGGTPRRLRSVKHDLARTLDHLERTVIRVG
jgi:hypothetical protein